MPASHVCHLLLAFTAAASVCLVGETNPVAQEQSRGRQNMPAEAGAQADTQLTIEEAKLSRLIELSTALQRQGRADEALAEAEDALKFAEKHFAPDSIWVGTALVNFSSMLVSRRDLVRAEPLLLRGIEILEQRLGADFDQGASISNFAKSFETLGDVAGAVRLYTLAVKAMERELGPDHPELGRILNSLGLAHRRGGDYRRAALAHERTLAIQEKALGAEHREVATTLNRLAAVLRLLGDLESAERHYAKALKIIEAREGPESVNAAIVTDNLGQVYKDKDDLARAELLHTRALRIFEQTFGAEHQDVATAVNNLASVFADRGDDLQAERLFKRALATREKLLGAEHPQTATVRDNLAVLYQERGDYASAEHLHREALKTIEAAYGPEHPFTSEFVANLAAFYRNMGDYVQAERLYRRALAVVEKTYSPAHRRAAVVLSELAETLTRKGDYVEATHAYRRALNTALEADGPESLLVATILDGLAERYHYMGDKELHDKMHDRSLAIRTKIYGEGDPALLGDYALRFYREGNLSRAEELFGLILAKQEERYGKDDPKVTPALEALATLYHFQERYEAAARLYARALAIQEKQLGPHHPEVGHSHFHLSVIRWAQGDISQSLHLLSRAQEIFEHNLASILATGSDRQKSFYLMAIAPPTSAAITLNVQSALKAPDATRVALTAVLRRKGRSLDAMTDQVGALRRRLDPQDRRLFDRLQGARTRLAALAYKDVGHVNAAQFRAQVLRLESEVESLEAQIGDRSQGFHEQTQVVTVESVQRLIPHDAALVELVSYSPYRPRMKPQEELYGPERYVAYVLRREGEPSLADLGPAADVDRLVDNLRRALSDRRSLHFKEAARALDEAVMRPVRKLLGDKRLVLLSPDGALNLVPFGALVDESGRYLVENYTFAYLTSGRDLMRLTTTAAERQKPLIIADPSFDEAVKDGLATAPATRGDADASRQIDLTKAVIKPLPNTAEEARDLKRLLADARVLTGAEANEAALKQVAGPRLLHIATHGFFRPHEPIEGPPPDKAWPHAHRHGGARELLMEPPAPRPGVFDTRPLLRSGLVLAGVKKLQSGAGEDGVLTALEVAGLDLWGTKLVVLSACDTGVGDVSSGQGVYGLRRALVLAGAESELMSLWPVSDAATRHLIVAYYQRLQRGVGRAESLRQVQLESIRHPKHNHPFYWAGFIPLGEWRPLPPSRAGLP